MWEVLTAFLLERKCFNLLALSSLLILLLACLSSISDSIFAKDSICLLRS